MQIGQAIFEALTKNDARLFNVVADWLLDEKHQHPEVDVYVKRLRLENTRIRTVVDVVCKFGGRDERKIFSRCNHILFELRHCQEKLQELASVTDLFSKEGRRQINRILKVDFLSRKRKKAMLVAIRKRHVLYNEYWYVEGLKILLSKYY